MADQRGFDEVSRRAFVPVWSGRTRDRKPVDLSHLAEPGRSWLEWSIMFSALALIFPEAGVLSLVMARLAARAHSPRATAATVVALWCLLFGLGIRLLLGFPALP